MKAFFKLLYKIAFWISLTGLIAIISDFGFSHTEFFQSVLDGFYFFVLGVGLTSTFARYIERFKFIKWKVFLFDFLSISFTLWVFYMYLFVGTPFETDLLLENSIWVKVAVLLSFIRESAELRINLNKAVLNPAQIFILSFLFLIIVGSLLLVLPNATHTSISYLDALFTATSAVCVTGLAVVDTGSHFTLFGQFIILILIQLGGLGILTFAIYFGYFFKGGTTYQTQLAISDITSSKTLGQVFSTLKYILLITFGIELFAGLLIYFSLDPSLFPSKSEQIFFSAFHSISAFCNAGFSTIGESFYDKDFRFNYPLQLIVVFTFFIGGLGFPIVANILKYFRYKITTIFSSRKSRYKPWVLNLNSKITVITTISIILFAFAGFYVFEYNNTLSEHEGFGKVVTALFGATTPRTAGFNTIETAALSMPAIILVIFLMWIGASPQSTGGGIKTSTFAIATLNIFSLSKGKSKIEIFNREISEISVRRAFAIIYLSLVVIGLAILLISVFDPEMELKDIVFECFSAYSTVGLSLGITSQLSSASKVVIIVVMFVGRVSMLSLAIAVFKKVKQKQYSFPKEELTIN